MNNTKKQKATILKIQSNLFAVFTPNQMKDFASNEGMLYTEDETYDWTYANCVLENPTDLSEMQFGEQAIFTMKKMKGGK